MYRIAICDDEAEARRYVAELVRRWAEQGEHEVTLGEYPSAEGLLFGDEAGYTPLLPMFTLGHDFKPANIHAGGLRYHGAGMIVSQLIKDGYMHGVDIPQLESFQAGILFSRTEGIVPAPESCHAIAATVREALKCREAGEQKTILFNLSGHGLIDMPSYDSYLNGDLMNYSLSDEELQQYLAQVPKIM